VRLPRVIRVWRLRQKAVRREDHDFATGDAFHRFDESHPLFLFEVLDDVGRQDAIVRSRREVRADVEHVHLTAIGVDTKPEALCECRREGVDAGALRNRACQPAHRRVIPAPHVEQRRTAPRQLLCEQAIVAEEAADRAWRHRPQAYRAWTRRTMRTSCAPRVRR